MSHVWAIAENDRAAKPLGLPEMIEGANQTLAELTDLTRLAPDEPRAYAHLGTAMVTIGSATGDLGMRDRGQAMVEKMTMPREKAEGSFALAAAFSQAPAGTPELARSVEYFFAAFEDCLGRTLDRDAPSFDGYDDRRTGERPRDVCYNQEHWPHAEEGNFLVFGDALVKAGKLGAARRAYEAAGRVPEAPKWRLKDVLAARLKEDLAARAASYVTPGASAAPVGAAPHLCGQCHAR
jgi:hypothetical protein